MNYGQSARGGQQVHRTGADASSTQVVFQGTCSKRQITGYVSTFEKHQELAAILAPTYCPKCFPAA